MIDSLNGILLEKQPARAVIEVHGVGYELFLPLSTYDRLPEPGASCRLLTFDYVREDARTLYGFHSAAERRMFTLLMGASGIGPKLALSALSALSVGELTSAVATGDFLRLSSIPGIGRKTAERLVVELRDRLGDAQAGEAALLGGAAPGDDRSRDVTLALTRLGYKPNLASRMAAEALRRSPSDAAVEHLIKTALRGPDAAP